MSEIADVVQIVRIEFEGMQLAMKVGSASIKTMQKAAKFLIGMLKHEKSKGKTGLKKLLIRGGDLQVFEFEEKDLKTVEKMCKKYGILYSLVPKLSDGTKREILFHAEATPRINMLLNKLKHPDDAKVKSMDSFLNETNDEKLDALGDFFQKEAMDEPDGERLAKHDDFLEKKAKETPDPEKLNALRDRMCLVEAEKNASLADITISKKLIEKETPTQILTRIPGTWGADSRYLWIDKTDIIPIHGGKTLLSFIDKNQSYPVCDKSGVQMNSIRGLDLYQTHYDQVDKSLRDKYEKLTRNKVTEKSVRSSPLEKTIKPPTLDKAKVR